MTERNAKEFRVLRVDHQLANILDRPVNSFVSATDLLNEVLRYCRKRRLGDPESNARDDWDPDRHLSSTVSAENGKVICEFCGHHIGFYDFALFTCRRCGKHLKVKELTELLFWVRAIDRFSKAKKDGG